MSTEEEIKKLEEHLEQMRREKKKESESPEEKLKRLRREVFLEKNKKPGIPFRFHPSIKRAPVRNRFKAKKPVQRQGSPFGNFLDDFTRDLTGYGNTVP